MGFSHQRQAAARTVLRARATGDQQIIEDAEDAVSGYLQEDLDEYIAEHYPNGLPTDDPSLPHRNPTADEDPSSASDPMTASELRDQIARSISPEVFAMKESPYKDPDTKRAHESLLHRVRKDAYLTADRVLAVIAPFIDPESAPPARTATTLKLSDLKSHDAIVAERREADPEYAAEADRAAEENAR